MDGFQIIWGVLSTPCKISGEPKKEPHSHGDSMYTSNKAFAYSVQSIEHRGDGFKRNSEKGKRNTMERHSFF